MLSARIVFKCVFLLAANLNFTLAGKCEWSNSTALSLCISQKLTAFRGNMTEDVSTYNVPRLEPLSIEQLDLSYGTSRRFTVKAILSQLNLKGLSMFNVTRMEIDTTRLRMKSVFTIPEVSVTGKYKYNGHIMFVPVSDSGQFDYNISTLVVKVTSAFHTKAVKRVGYLRLTDIAIDFDLGRFNLDIGKYFRGFQFLRERINDYLNNNMGSIRSQFKRDVTRQLDQLAFNSMNRILQTIPIKSFIKA